MRVCVQGISVSSLWLPKPSVSASGEQNRSPRQPEGSIQQASLQGQLQGSRVWDAARHRTGANTLKTSWGTSENPKTWASLYVLQLFGQVLLICILLRIRPRSCWTLICSFKGVAGENSWLGSGWIQFLGKAGNQYIWWVESGEGENWGKRWLRRSLKCDVDWQTRPFIYPWFLSLRKCQIPRTKKNWWLSWSNRRSSSPPCLMRSVMTISSAKVAASYWRMKSLYCVKTFILMNMTSVQPGERRLSYKALQGALMIFFYRYVDLFTAGFPSLSPHKTLLKNFYTVASAGLSKSHTLPHQGASLLMLTTASLCQLGFSKGLFSAALTTTQVMR